MMESRIETVRPQWPQLPHIETFTTTRAGGVSQIPYDSLNFGLHVGDDSSAVTANRERLCHDFEIPQEPAWLRQTHGISVRDNFDIPANQSFDAAWTNLPGQVLVVLTADCLPVAMVNRAGTEIALAHAGWRGLADGVLRTTVARFSTPPSDVQVWLGPAIGPTHFEVGDEVRLHFQAAMSNVDITRAFRPGKVSGKWFADLYLLARLTLKELGVQEVSGGDYCTYADQKRFFSYRRDGLRSGRMATLAWIKA